MHLSCAFHIIKIITASLKKSVAYFHDCFRLRWRIGEENSRGWRKEEMKRVLKNSSV